MTKAVTKPTRKTKKDNALEWAVPKALKIPPDPLELRVDFHKQAVVIYTFAGDTTNRKIVSAMDIANALAKELNFSSGLLPRNALWWANTSAGPITALYEEPRVRKLAIQYEIGKAPKRYTIPLPGILFLVTPGKAPRVFAMKYRPYKLDDYVYHIPMPNMSSDGTSCAGSQKYSTDITKIPEYFWLSFFTDHGDLQNRSNKFPKNLIRLWEDLAGQKKFPLEDLVQTCTIGELMNPGERRR